jgi:hypothetical protein
VKPHFQFPNNILGLSKIDRLAQPYEKLLFLLRHNRDSRLFVQPSPVKVGECASQQGVCGPLFTIPASLALPMLSGYINLSPSPAFCAEAMPLGYTKSGTVVKKAGGLKSRCLFRLTIFPHHPSLHLFLLSF